MAPLARLDAGTIGLRAPRIIAVAFGFCCFMPYAAVSVGANTAVQSGNLLSILIMLPMLVMSWRGRRFWIIPALVAPLVLSTAVVAFTGGDLHISINTLFAWALSAITLIAMQVLGPLLFLHLLAGVAAAAVVHALFGVWQYFAFQAGYFPLDWFFQNKSFLSIQDNLDIIVRYIQRPFGLFPEPSAMSASLAPFVLLWFAMLGGLVRLRRQPPRSLMILFTLAACGSLALMILSRSGHTAITLAAGAVLAVVWFKRSRATPGNALAILIALGVVLPMVIYFAADALDDRMGGAEMGNSSWAERSSSMLIGLKLVGQGGIPAVFFGLGTGMMAPLMQKLYGLEAVWSITLTYFYETGLIGLLATLLIGRHLLLKWKQSAFDPVFAAIFFVWIVGITITTSYVQLLPIWLAVGLLVMWNDIIEPAGVARAATRRLRFNNPISPPSQQTPDLPPVRRWSQQSTHRKQPSRRWRDT